jgi:hypothetical protein
VCVGGAGPPVDGVIEQSQHVRVFDEIILWQEEGEVAGVRSREMGTGAMLLCQRRGNTSARTYGNIVVHCM